MLGKRRIERLEVLASFVWSVFELIKAIDYFVVELWISKAKLELNFGVIRGMLR